MPVEKSKRNKLIEKLWLEGKSNREILTRLKQAGYRDLQDTKSFGG